MDNRSKAILLEDNRWKYKRDNSGSYEIRDNNGLLIEQHLTNEQASSLISEHNAVVTVLILSIK